MCPLQVSTVVDLSLAEDTWETEKLFWHGFDQSDSTSHEIAHMTGALSFV
jgi:hypothetical protein